MTTGIDIPLLILMSTESDDATPLDWVGACVEIAQPSAYRKSDAHGNTDGILSVLDAAREKVIHQNIDL